MAYVYIVQSDTACILHLIDRAYAVALSTAALPAPFDKLRTWLRQAQDEQQHGTSHCICCSFFRSASEKTNNKKKIKYRLQSFPLKLVSESYPIAQICPLPPSATKSLFRR